MPFNIFQPQDVADLLAEFGVSVDYYEVYHCSCQGDNDGVYDPKDDCYYGYRYKPPVSYNKDEGKGLIRTSFKMGIENIMLEKFFNGGCKFSIFKNDISGIALPIFQSITWGDVLVIKSDVVRMVDWLNIDHRNYLYAFSVTEIVSVTQKDKFFEQGKDFNYDPGTRMITWLDDGDKPTSSYVVQFMASPNYFIYSQQAKIRGGEDDMVPKSVTAILRPFAEADGKNPLDKIDFSLKLPDNINI